jgi:hypothetical protein
MSSRKPLVIVDGQIEQLQAGDTLDAAQGGGTQVVLTNDESGSIVIGTPVYADAADGVKKAKANALSTSGVIGLVADASISAAGTGAIQLDGIFTATTGQWDTVTGGSGGLTFNTRYYLDPSTAGKITSTAPTTVAQVVMPIGIAISTTEMKLTIDPTQNILL